METTKKENFTNAQEIVKLWFDKVLEDQELISYAENNYVELMDHTNNYNSKKQSRKRFI